MAALSKKRYGNPPGSGEPSPMAKALLTKGIELVIMSKQKGKKLFGS